MTCFQEDVQWWIRGSTDENDQASKEDPKINALLTGYLYHGDCRPFKRKEVNAYLGTKENQKVS